MHYRYFSLSHIFFTVCRLFSNEKHTICFSFWFECFELLSLENIHGQSYIHVSLCIKVIWRERSKHTLEELLKRRKSFIYIYIYTRKVSNPPIIFLSSWILLNCSQWRGNGMLGLIKFIEPSSIFYKRHFKGRGLFKDYKAHNLVYVGNVKLLHARLRVVLLSIRVYNGRKRPNIIQRSEALIPWYSLLILILSQMYFKRKYLLKNYKTHNLSIRW